jgi:hypothetical protein
LLAVSLEHACSSCAHSHKFKKPPDLKTPGGFLLLFAIINSCQRFSIGLKANLMLNSAGWMPARLP